MRIALAIMLMAAFSVSVMAQQEQKMGGVVKAAQATEPPVNLAREMSKASKQDIQSEIQRLQKLRSDTDKYPPELWNIIDADKKSIVKAHQDYDAIANAHVKIRKPTKDDWAKLTAAAKPYDDACTSYKARIDKRISDLQAMLQTAK
jgi:hypothetical protein